MPIEESLAIVLETACNFPGAHQSSPSRNATISPLHSGIPALKAEACPPFSLRSSRTRGSNFFTISGLRSAEPSATTMISRSASGKSCSSALTIACSMKRSWLCVSIRTLTKLRAKVRLPENPQSRFWARQYIYVPLNPRTRTYGKAAMASGKQAADLIRPIICITRCRVVGFARKTDDAAAGNADNGANQVCGLFSAGHGGLPVRSRARVQRDIYVLSGPEARLRIFGEPYFGAKFCQRSD